MKTIIFCPVSQDGKQIGQVNSQEIFSLVPDEPKELFVEKYVNYKSYRVNIGNIRMVLFKKNRTCLCCGIIGNQMFVDIDTQNSESEDKPFYHLNLYAESKDYTSEKTHLVLMTKDHIVPVSKGGSDDVSNFQVLCYNCNSIKADLNLSIDQIRSMLFPAYRAYKSSRSVNYQRKLNEKKHAQILRCHSAIEQMQKNMNKIQNKEKVLNRINEMKKEIADLQEYCYNSELFAQTNGIEVV